MKSAYSGVYLCQTMWNPTKKSMKKFKRPNSLFLQWEVSSSARPYITLARHITLYRMHSGGSDQTTVNRIWDTDYNSDNWDPEFITIFVAWQLRVTLDSIRNSCDVLGPFLYLSGTFSRYFHKNAAKRTKSKKGFKNRVVTTFNAKLTLFGDHFWAFIRLY